MFSTNKFFSLGFCEILKSTGMNIAELNKNNLKKAIHSKEKTVFFLHITSADELNHLPKEIFSHSQIVPIIESKRGKENIYLVNNGILSAKIDVNFLKKFINCVIYRNEHKKSVTLTSIENRVLAYLTEGVSPQQISKRMGISVKTISSHKRNALSKYGFSEVSTYAIHRFRILKNISLHQRMDCEEMKYLKNTLPEML
ncbi:helix-turn-helix transcriptional regulator [Serratia sarumanii]|uniref:helix-turn-helix transcriptional regulator n=1 Tax=Serratia sarumanii TaxID=3020826 RepID=UPI003F7EBB15